MTVLDVIAARYVPTIIEAVRHEFPNAPRHVMRHRDDLPRPRELHPAFYGCFDWHSAVEMHWALVALVRAAPGGAGVAAPGGAGVGAARGVLDEHLTEAALRTEADYFGIDAHFERPYGWGWLLQLAAELEEFAAGGDADAARWAAAVRPLAEVIEASFLRWLPRPAYPDRSGTHANSAFAMTRSLPWARHRAREGRPALLDALHDTARRWFAADTGYSAAFEPSGSDFLSPLLTEAELMQQVLPRAEFRPWYERFSTETVPGALRHPARVTDPQDGQGAHLHGLNLYRIAGLRALRAADLPAADLAELDACIAAHVQAGQDALLAEGWMAEHWLAAYGVLAFRDDAGTAGTAEPTQARR